MTIEKIDTSNAKFYEKFILNNTIGQNTLAFGAKAGEFACGIILAEKSEEEIDQWDIKVFFISQIFRYQSIGPALIKLLINTLKEKGCKKIIFQAVTSKKSIDELGRFLYKYGFSKPELLTVIYRFNPDVLLKNNSFVKSAYTSIFTCPKNVKIVSINEIDPPLLDKIKNNETLHFPDNLSPFANEHDLSATNTWFAITDQNEIVGWITGLSAPGDIILYRSFFVREDYRNSALGFFIINKAIKFHAEQYKNKQALCAIAIDNEKTLKFLSLYFKNLYEHKKYEFFTFIDLD
ncbi:MAG: hypothetical protein RUMPE_01049 [Eubacteriales bacterium SKADARSKE-1]|nr:hypothetical protein [Eubacteriales bacterium SKADARSKE-1]